MLNMWQWIDSIKVENLGKELQTNFDFFICVWLIPLTLSLVLELVWEDVPFSSLCNSENDKGRFSTGKYKSGTLESIPVYAAGKCNPISCT